VIVYLNGVLAEKSPDNVVVECCGVGYEALIPLSTFDRLPATGENVKLFTYHAVREDDEILFGFFTRDERDMFVKVTAVSGVGPKTALAVLSGFTTGDLQLAIAQGDAKRIATVKGIGKKTAERIVVELKDKVNPIEALANSSVASTGTQRAVLRDAMLALTALGFSDDKARKMVSDVLEADPQIADTEAVIKKALGGGR
jgi:Holliday junction DNA helicase RuvA